MLVAAGFGVWQAGRHLASARWTDVVRVRALAGGSGTVSPLGLAVVLRDGTEVLIQDTLPGFIPFISAAETALPGMRRRATWLADARQSETRADTVLFERYPPKPAGR